MLKVADAFSGAGSALLVKTLTLFVVVLSAYVVIHLEMNRGPDSAENRITAATELQVKEEEKKKTQENENGDCTTVDDFLDADEPGTATAEDPWRQMKWIGKASRCRVSGYAIERLDTAYNFRRGYALRHVEDVEDKTHHHPVEDKTHLLPWLLAPRNPKMAEASRRVLLDLGASSFDTSLMWFMRMYPLDFTEVHAFEVDRNLLRLPTSGFDEAANVASSNPSSLMTKARPSVPPWMVRRIHTYTGVHVDDIDDGPRGCVNITRFILDELRLVEDDAVVIKMDIEGSEWPILRRWIAQPRMARIVDELFVEVHYNHPSMWDFGWATYGNITRDDATRMLAQLRFHGFFAHAWP